MSTNKILYEIYIRESGDIITPPEWMLSEDQFIGKRKKFESYWRSLKQYGIFGLASHIMGDKPGSVNTGILSIPISFILYAGFKKYLNDCKDNCKEKLCVDKCHLQACIPIIKDLDREIKTVRSSKLEPKIKKKVLIKLNKQLEKWVKRYNRYKEIVKKQVQYNATHTKTDSAKAFYYGEDS